MSSVSIESIRKCFGDIAAVDDVSLEIRSGDLFFLLGPSGCGKTTLLRMIAGFATPTSGSIRIGDVDVTKLSPEKRDAGMVFQSYALWPHMTVRENVAFGLKVRKLPRTEIASEVNKALELVRMSEYATRKPNELSGGQQQRVALARALAFKPRILLLDEPLSNLDAKLRIEMRSEIRRIVDELNMTTIYVTHDQKEALSLADDMVVLRDGKVVQQGAPQSLYAKPRTRFTADFLGETNLVSCEIKSADSSRRSLQTEAGQLHSESFCDDAPKAGNVTASIRPECLQLLAVGEKAPAGHDILHGTVVERIFLGEIAQYKVEVAEHLRLKVLDLNPRKRFTGNPSENKVQLAVAPQDVVLLRD